MAVKLRLRREGKKKQPYYRVVAADSRSPRDGRFIEILGYYHPLAKKKEDQVKISKEKLEAWLKKGAQPSEKVKHLLKLVK